MFDIYIYNIYVNELGERELEQNKIYYSPLFKCFISYTGLWSPYIVHTISLGDFDNVKDFIKEIRTKYGYKKPKPIKKVRFGFHHKKESKNWS